MEEHLFSDSEESDNDHDHFHDHLTTDHPSSAHLWEEELTSSSPTAPAPPVNIEIYAGRLKRRIELIREMRAAYLRDVVLMKQLMIELLSSDERRLLLLKQQESALPSLDLQKFFLSKPIENSFDILPCVSCGGTIEIVHHDSVEIKKLTTQLEQMDQSKGNFRLIIATKTTQLDQAEEKIKINERKYREEVHLPS
jgi:hypothetical protein